ncbi:MAG TPA: siroheme synthase CysG [Xanthobacteraceae bacterium]|nr:siroheme synthase CysG [Xanthobacteraceae bacterium]
MTDTRRPAETRPPRMDQLARLPLFFALTGQRAVVAGGGAAAAWKAELLAATGAQVEVYAPVPGDDLRELAADTADGRVVVHHRRWTSSDLAGAAIAIGAMEDDEEAQAFAGAARAAGVPVNIVDKPVLCDFTFGSIVNRSPLVIGISTDGAAPVFAQAIRAKLEALIPRGFALWADAAHTWRPRVQALALSFRSRRRFWETFTDRAVRHPDRTPAQSDFDAVLAQAMDAPDSSEQGSVTLVGAGPGDPELLTLRAVRALQSAEVILYDDLVAPEILEFARREAKKMLVGKTGHAPSCKQDDINTLMVSLAKSGRRVVRLKGGDPMIFGRAGEEIAACREAGIAVDIVPGITAAQGAASRLGVSLTHRAQARRVQYVTGHDRHGRLPADLDWRSIADPVATTIVYMPRKTISELASRAIAAGLDPGTPALAMVNATRPQETSIRASIGDIADRIAACGIDGPMLVMIGSALAACSETERGGTERSRSRSTAVRSA